MRLVDLGAWELELESTEGREFQSIFQFAFALTDLQSKTTIESTLKLPASSGCYFWLMGYDSRRFKIYIGKARSIRKRITDYAKGFQPHSPNDYKLRLFQEGMNRDLASATLELYYVEVAGEKQRGEAETKFKCRFRPRINYLPKPLPQEREAIRNAYRDYYQSCIARHIADSG